MLPFESGKFRLLITFRDDISRVSIATRRGPARGGRGTGDSSVGQDNTYIVIGHLILLINHVQVTLVSDPITLFFLILWCKFYLYLLVTSYLRT